MDRRKRNLRKISFVRNAKNMKSFPEGNCSAVAKQLPVPIMIMLRYLIPVLATPGGYNRFCGPDNYDPRPSSLFVSCKKMNM